MRIAHFSDIHYTLSPLSDLRASLAGKRVAGWASYFLGGRGARFAGSAARIAALLDDVDAQRVDHAICTGDLTQVSRADEFAGLARVFGTRMREPQRYTVIPGNHDRYVASAAHEFDTTFAALSGKFPFSKSLPGLRIIGLDPCRPTGLTDASGLCGPEQRHALARLLAEDVHTPTIVALHYGLLRHTGKRDNPHHCMHDAPEVQALIDASPANVALIIHGHMHGAFTVPTDRCTIVCAGSAIDLRVANGYFIYELDNGRLTATRRAWNRSTARYEAVDSQAFNQAIAERRGARFS